MSPGSAFRPFCSVIVVVVVFHCGDKNGIPPVEKAGSKGNMPIVVQYRLVDKAEPFTVHHISGHGHLGNVPLMEDERAKAERAGFAKESYASICVDGWRIGKEEDTSIR